MGCNELSLLLSCVAGFCVNIVKVWSWDTATSLGSRGIILPLASSNLFILFRTEPQAFQKFWPSFFTTLLINSPEDMNSTAVSMIAGLGLVNFRVNWWINMHETDWTSRQYLNLKYSAVLLQNVRMFWILWCHNFQQSWGRYQHAK